MWASRPLQARFDWIQPVAPREMGSNGRPCSAGCIEALSSSTRSDSGAFQRVGGLAELTSWHQVDAVHRPRVAEPKHLFHGEFNPD